MKKLYSYLLRSSNWVIAGLLSLIGYSCSDSEIDDNLICMYGTPYGTFELKGKVLDNQKHPIPNVQILIRDSVPSRGWIKSDTIYSDNNGEIHWKLKDFPGYTYQLIASDIDDDKNGGHFASDTSFINTSQLRYVGGDGAWNEGTATADISIVMDEYVDTHTEPYALYTIYGRVTNEEGTPLIGIIINTSPGYLPEKPANDWDYPAITDYTGRYSLTYDQAQPVKHVIQTSFLKNSSDSEVYISATDSVNFADLKLTGGKGLLIGKGSKEVNFVLKKK